MGPSCTMLFRCMEDTLSIKITLQYIENKVKSYLPYCVHAFVGGSHFPFSKKFWSSTIQQVLMIDNCIELLLSETAIVKQWLYVFACSNKGQVGVACSLNIVHFTRLRVFPL